MTLKQEELFAKYANSKPLRKRIDSLFTSTEKYFEEAAKEHRLQLRKWYHDAPLWMLFFPAGPCTRVMHVGPTMIGGELSLTIAITAYRDEADKSVRHVLPQAKIIGRIPEDLFQRESESLGSVVRELILKGYVTGQAIAVPHLTKSVSLGPS